MVIAPGYLHIAEASIFINYKKIARDILLTLLAIIIGGVSGSTGLLLFLPLIAIGLLVYDVMYAKSHKYIFYTDKVIVLKGIFTKNQDQVFLSKVLAVRYKQTFLGQIFNYGNVFVDQLGENDFMCVAIKDPQKLVDALSPLVTSVSSPIF